MRLILSYMRVDGDLSTGDIRTDDDGEELVWTTFTQSNWRMVTNTFARAVAAYPDVKDVYIKRTDRPGLIALKLKEEEVELWRRDPIEAMRSWELPQQTISLRESVGRIFPVSACPVSESFPPLRAGQETLAQCFGDIVYTRYRANLIECFGCGRWVSEDQSTTPASHFVCDSCGSFAIQNPHELTEWVGVYVRDLLTSSLSRFYIPRAWNKHGKWITREQLSDFYNQYRLEKDTLSS